MLGAGRALLDSAPTSPTASDATESVPAARGNHQAFGSRKAFRAGRHRRTMTPINEPITPAISSLRASQINSITGSSIRITGAASNRLRTQPTEVCSRPPRTAKISTEKAEAITGH